VTRTNLVISEFISIQVSQSSIDELVRFLANFQRLMTQQGWHVTYKLRRWQQIVHLNANTLAII